MLANSNNLLFKHRDALFYQRKYEMHSLNEEQIKEQRAALEFLLGLTIPTVDEVQRRKEELRRICLSKGINNVLLGKDYDPNKYDFTKDHISFGYKLQTQVAADPNLFYKYKKDTREVLEQKV
jgi:hypothetical protein